MESCAPKLAVAGNQNRNAASARWVRTGRPCHHVRRALRPSRTSSASTIPLSLSGAFSTAFAKQ